MPEFTGNEDKFEGPLATAEKLAIREGAPDFAATVAHWLITHPSGHPAWSQYVLFGYRLAEYENMPAPVINVLGATHDIIIATLNPEEGKQTAETMMRYSDPQDELYRELPTMYPLNVSWQFAGTDEECNLLITAAAWGLTAGLLWPEVLNHDERLIRKEWYNSLELTLKHIRGLPHERYPHVHN